jgi:hypothetical protein
MESINKLPIKMLDVIAAICDLINRELVEKTKLAAKRTLNPSNTREVIVSNNLLTKKGEELAKDFQYLRDNKDIVVSRPLVEFYVDPEMNENQLKEYYKSLCPDVGPIISGNRWDGNGTFYNEKKKGD